MPTDALTGLPYPSGGEAAAGPAAFQALVEGLRPMLRLPAADASDRDARYRDAPAGVQAYSTAAPWKIWAKTSAAGTNSWITVYSDTGWLNNAVTQDNTAVFSITGQWCRVYNGVTDLQLRVTYTGTDVTAPASGNITNLLVGAVDPTYGPKDFANLSTGHIGPVVAGAVQGGGTITMSAVATLPIANGDSFTLQGSWQAVGA